MKTCKNCKHLKLSERISDNNQFYICAIGEETLTLCFHWNGIESVKETIEKTDNSLITAEMVTSYREELYRDLEMFEEGSQEWGNLLNSSQEKWQVLMSRINQEVLNSLRG